MDDNTHGELNRNGIDVARDFSHEGYGKIDWSSRTISPLVSYRFLSTPVIMNVIAESLEIGLKPFVQKPIDGRGKRAAEIRGTIEGLLWRMWNSDELFGATAKDAFMAKNVSTLADIEQGRIVLEVYVKTVTPAEQIDITLFKVPFGFNFQTGVVTPGEAEFPFASV
jgi:phage tail sheath protein FI